MYLKDVTRTTAGQSQYIAHALARRGCEIIWVLQETVQEDHSLLDLILSEGFYSLRTESVLHHPSLRPKPLSIWEEGKHMFEAVPISMSATSAEHMLQSVNTHISPMRTVPARLEYFEPRFSMRSRPTSAELITTIGWPRTER